jgi:hypothetical protein
MSSFDFQYHIRLLCHFTGVRDDHYALPEHMGALFQNRRNFLFISRH